MKRFGTIELKNLKFHAYHGCLPEERTAGNDFVVNLSCKVDMRLAARTDLIGDTLDYAVLYNIVKDAMATQSFLLEHVAGTILSEIKRQAPEVKKATVTVCKMRPPFTYATNALDTPETAACITLSF